MNINTVKKEDLDFTAPIRLRAQYSEYLHALVGYFDIFFPGKEVSFSTGPSSRETHWKQTVFYLREKLWVCCDDELVGSLRCSKVKENPRDLDIHLDLTLNQKGHDIHVEQDYRIRSSVCSQTRNGFSTVHSLSLMETVERVGSTTQKPKSSSLSSHRGFTGTSQFQWKQPFPPNTSAHGL